MESTKAPQLAQEIERHLRFLLPDHKDHPRVDVERYDLAAAVRGWQAQAEAYTNRDVLNAGELRDELRRVSALLEAVEPPSTYLVRRALERAKDAASAPDTTNRDLVDRHFDP